ncbi:MAG: glycolate oxidase iron-sulfur subunit [Halioglobus sp.]|jgi:glycolate oxidase iron-sulfur subunit
MHTQLHPRFADTTEGLAAKELTNACVHCGFCLTTCPTYLDTRDERDSPRGRIYLIKQLMETGEATEQTRTHLDRCLTCRNCETSCPSGMEYGQLVDIGRGLMEQEAPRSAPDRLTRWLIRFVMLRPSVLNPLLLIGQTLRPLLPKALRNKIPPRQTKTVLPAEQQVRKMLILEGCVQSAATPNTNAAARRVLNQLGVTLIGAPEAGCCGALNYHLAAHDDGLDNMRRNIDAWWPFLEAGAEAIVSSASGCGAMLVDYGRLLAQDPAYSEKAAQVSELCKDLSEILAAEDLAPLSLNVDIGKVAVHTPCTLKNALHQPELVANILSNAGFHVCPDTRPTLCCGSAGTYSILQPAASERILGSTLEILTAEQPDLIATANVGCQLHLQAGGEVPVVHWIELLDGK